MKELGAYFEKNWRELPDFKDYLYGVAEQQFGNPLPLDAACWFHTSRTAPGTTFSEGILPLAAVLPQLKAKLVDLVADTHVREQLREALSSGGIADHHFANKTQNSIHWGPYAILVREVAFCASKLSQHDYLGMPEIIEDICNGFETTSGKPLMDVFSMALQPTIVKFSHAVNDDESCIATALCYVYSTLHTGGPCTNSVYCFDGENVPVPPQDILKVERVVVG